MAQRNDQVFQLSLTEIAFTIIFILLLLLGYQIFKEQSDRREAEEALNELRALAHSKASVDNARQQFAAELRASSIRNPEEVVTKLLAAQAKSREVESLNSRVVDLEARLSVFKDVRDSLNAVRTDGRELLKDEALAALVLTREVRSAVSKEMRDEAKAVSDKKNDAELLTKVKRALAISGSVEQALRNELGISIRAGQESTTISDVVKAARAHGETGNSGQRLDVVRKENSDLRGQVSFLKNRLEARGGRDYPPCWADENGRVEFLFNVELGTDNLRISPSWPAKREADARSLPFTPDGGGEAVSYAAFRTRAQSILDWSQRQNPQCRHYVQLRSGIADAVHSDRARLMVEDYFYKAEARR
jgi:hypothetical protein